MGQIVGYGKSGHYSLTIAWTEAVNTAANTSTLNFTVTFAGNWSCHQSSSHAGTLTVNGTSYSFTVPALSWTNSGSATIFAKSGVTIAHNADGTATLSASCTYNCNLLSFSDGSAAMPNIGASGSAALTTIARASTITSVTSPVNIGSKTTVKWTPADSSYKYSLYFWVGDYNWTVSGIAPATTSAYSYSWTVPTSLLSAMPTSTSVVMGVRLDSYNSAGTKLGGSSATFTVTVASSVAPSISAFTVSPDNSANSVIKGWGLYVKGYTKPKLAVTASAGTGSTIKTYTVTGAATGSYSSMPQTLGTISKSGSLTYKVSVTDGRNRTSGTSSSTIKVYDYSTPQITYFNVYRVTGDDTHAKVTLNLSIASVNSKNSYTATLSWKASTATSWTTYGAITSGTTSLSTSTVTLDEETEYNFKVVVKDSVGNSATAEKTVGTAAVLMTWNSTGDGISFGQIKTTRNALTISKDWTQYLGGLSMADTDTTPVMADFGAGYYTNNDVLTCSSVAALVTALWVGSDFSVTGTVHLTASSTMNGVTIPSDYYVYHAVAYGSAMGAILLFGVNGNSASYLTAYWVRVSGTAPVFFAPIADAKPVWNAAQSLGSASAIWTTLYCQNIELMSGSGGYIDFHIGSDGDYGTRLANLSTGELTIYKSGGGYGALQLDDLIAHHGIELYNSGDTPYIDFHYKNTTSDFDTRIINSSSGTLSFQKSGGYATLVAASYSQSSSINLKRDVEDMPSITETLMSLRPVRYNYKSDPEDAERRGGLIAEEVHDILPDIVAWPDGYDPDAWKEGDPAPGIDYSKLTPYLLRMLQEQQKKIEDLEARVKALEKGE